MDVALAQRLAAAPDPHGLNRLLQQSADPAVSKAVAQQFGALFMQGLMQQSDGAGIAMTEGVGNGVVNGLFATTMSQAAMSGEKLGLADMLLKSIEAKQPAASNGSNSPAATGAVASAPANPPNKAPAAGGLPLGPYWQGNGMRPVGSTGAGHLRVPAAAPQGLPLTAASLSPLPSRTAAGPANSGKMTPISLIDGLRAPQSASPQQVVGFTQQLVPLLKQAGEQLGVSPRILLAQAALETGWGRAVVGNNIFGIKAGSSWTGETVTTPTHEYQDGQLVSITDSFRAYPSFDAAVKDFVSLLSTSQRYRAALGSGDDVAAYARALVAGGWATDIDYVQKLQSVAAGPSASAVFAAAQ